MVFIPSGAPSPSSYNVLHQKFQMVMEAVVIALLTLLMVLSSCVSLLFLHYFYDISPTSSIFLSYNFIFFILFYATVSLSFIPSPVFLFFQSLSSLFVIFTSLLLLLCVSHILFLSFYSFFIIFFIQVKCSLFPPSQHLSTFSSILALYLYSFLIFFLWRFSFSTALFSLSYVTVPCDIYNSIKLYTKLIFSPIVSCIT